MDQQSAHLSLSVFRHRPTVVIVLTFLCLNVTPSLAFAQGVTASFGASNGTILLNSREAEPDAVLTAGDAIETPSGTHVTLELSDGSQLELGEHAKLELTTLDTTTDGARRSLVNVKQGWLRARLSQEHQAPGSSFEIETPNALIGVTFSQPDVEVNYDPATEETIALARTVALSAKNLLTDEEKTVPVGSAIIISLLGMNVSSGTAATELMTSAVAKSTESSAAATGTAVGTTETTATTVGIAETTTTGSIGTGTMIAIGAGAAVAIGGGVAIASSNSDSGNSDNSDGVNGGGTDTIPDLSGNWRMILSGTSTDYQNGDYQGTNPLELDAIIPTPIVQNGKSVSASWTSGNGTETINGTISGNFIQFTWQIGQATQLGFNGSITGNTLSGSFSGTGTDDDPSSGWVTEMSGNFTVNVTQ